jgi:hypothetical protein
MVGMGTTYGANNPLSLEYLVRNEKRYQHWNVWNDDHDDDDGTEDDDTDDDGTEDDDFNDLETKLRLDVRYVFVNEDFDVQINDWLQLPSKPDDDLRERRRRQNQQEEQKKDREKSQDNGISQSESGRTLDSTNVAFGIELQFGYIMGELLDDSPVLLIKSCIGNRALGWDLLPPTVTTRYNDTTQGYEYPAYGEKPERWFANSTKPDVPSFSWYAGKQYDDDVRNAKKVLQNLHVYYPGLFASDSSGSGDQQEPNYEIAGFLWWQGARDTMMEGHAMQYESNLVHFIDSIRNDFDDGRNKAREAKFLIASIGFGGYAMPEFTNWVKQVSRGNQKDDDGAPYFEKVFTAQMTVNNYTKYPQYQNNVYAVDIRSSFRNPSNANWNWAHYNCDARVYMEVSKMVFSFPHRTCLSCTLILVQQGGW